MSNRVKVVALIDGEHYLPVIQAALEELRREYELLGAVFIGGTEKITDDTDLSMLGCPVAMESDPLKALAKSLSEHRPDKVIDLSDEPVVGYRERFEMASLVLARGISYMGSDFHFAPPDFHRAAAKPSMAIIGTGKRVGKTAVSAFACRELKARGYDPCVVAMGRGGPAEPEVILGDKIEIDAGYLLEASREGHHAASDYFEDALMSRIPTVGCRRCGGGMAGAPFISNVLRGAELANDLAAKMIIFEGSGAALPPIATDSRVVVCGANQPLEYIVGYLGRYRLMISDLAVLTNCETEIMANRESDAIIREIKKVNPNLRAVKTVFRPQPLKNIDGEKVFFTTTAPSWVGPKLKIYLEEQFGCRLAGISHHLSNRRLLREEIAAKEGQFSLLLTELKAAAVDVTTEIGERLSVPVVYCDNVPITVGGDGELGSELENLAARSKERFQAQPSRGNND